VKIYISGPITGIENDNREAFQRKKKALKKCGYKVFSPIDAPKFKTWVEYMRYDIKRLCDCDAICMLPGWKQSIGATLELHIARVLELDIFYHDQ